MARPLVTIAIPTYNRSGGYLREALASALAQRYEPLEIVVVDNASTDATGAYVASVADERVRYVRNATNLGVVGNFNACLEHARGAYFLLLHDDDHIDADFVESCVGAIERDARDEPPGVVRTGTRVIDANGDVQSERINAARIGTVADLAFSWFDSKTSLYFCSTLYHTQSLREAGGFTSRRDLYIDVAAVLRIAAVRHVLDVPDVKASFRRHGGNNGNAQTIEAWCDDSHFLLELMCDLSPERSEELLAKGRMYFSSNNYSRVARLDSFLNRITSYWVVYRSFGFRASPLRFVAYRNYLRLKHTLRASTS